jgi:urea transport system permease protein
LSLGHGAFFALGGYCMGMYLMRQIGTRGVYGNPLLPDFMVFLQYKELPWFWWGFDHFAWAMAMVMLVPGVFAFVFGWLAFRSRVTGVYLSIITQAMTYALWLAFFRNDMGFGGNNGLTDYKDILGWDVHLPQTRLGLYIATVVGLGAGSSRCRSSGACCWRCATPKAACASSAIRRPVPSCSSSRSRRCSPESPARSTCRRSASSTRANSRRATPSRP